MSPIWILTSAIFAPVAAGLATLCLPRRAIGWRTALAVAGPAAALYLLGSHIAGRSGAIAGSAYGAEWMPAVKLNLELNADQLGLFFALLVAAIGLLITLYARAYFGPDRDSLYRFFPSLHLFMTAMLGVALADGFMFLLLFWELTSISSFLLIGWDRDDPEAVKKAMQAFVVTGIGGLCLMAGLILLGIHSGSWTFSELLANREALVLGPRLTCAFVLIFIGAAAKSAQWPLHFWLPGAMAAPTPVSAYLHSATMVKAGVYLTGRMWPILAAALPLWPKLIIPIGALTMVYAAFVALQKTDLKQIFAYTTVSQLGLLMCMYGLGAVSYGHGIDAAPNLLWDVSQILNHALYKAPLFILAGAIGHIASRQLPELRGLFYRGRTPRIMALVLILAAYAMAAGPLTVSFTAKEIFFYQIWHAYKQTHSPWFMPLVAAGVATGMFNVAIFLRLAATLLARGQTEHAAHGESGHGHETGLWPAFLWLPGALIVSIQFVGGIVPGAFEWLFGWLEPNMQNYDLGASVGNFPMTWDVHPGAPLFMSLAAIGLGVTLAMAPVLRRVFHDPHDRIYPAFYALCTQGGGRLFGFVQTGHARTYLMVVFLAIVAAFAWSIDFDFSRFADLGSLARFEAAGPLLPGLLITGVVCVSALMMPIVEDRASRVLVLGSCGFAITAVYYLYKAPDLALTQISIEIVSLILFLLVLSLLPTRSEGGNTLVVPRALIGVAVGAVMFWLTLTSSVGPRPTMPYVRASDGAAIAHLGEFFLRNSNHAMDANRWAGAQTSGVVVRGRGADGRGAMLHSGGGGRNVVNVILVDGRGFDTLGEITVLALAAIGVWTLLRRHGRQAARPDTPAGHEPHDELLDIDIPAPEGEEDSEDLTLSRMLNRSVQS